MASPVKLDKLESQVTTPAVTSDEREYSTLSSLEKAAILMISIGDKVASELFKRLNPSELEPLVYQIAHLKPFSNAIKKRVLIEFNNMVKAQEYINIGGVDYARAILEQSIGAIKAGELISKIVYVRHKPFDSLKRADASQIYDFIHTELSQTIALVLSYVDPLKASHILSMLPMEKQADVAKRIATMGQISPEMIRDIERVIERKISALAADDILVSGGIESAVQILNVTERATERNIMESIEETDPELAEEIKKRMFVFEDILLLDDRSIQRVLSEVDSNELAKSLKGIKENVSEKVLGNMSKRASEMIKEEIEYMGPVRVKEVEEVQQKIVGIIRKLEEQGEIVISRGEQETFV